MLQAIIKKGQVFADEIPVPYCDDNFVLIQVLFSAVSPGTELTSLRETRKSLITNTLEQPDKIIKYIKKIKTDGIIKTLNEIKEFNNIRIPIGYSVAGRVIAKGKNIKNISVGDLVAAAGGGYAYHAEFVAVPQNLVVKLPPNIDLKFASTVAIGSIALHGTRRANLKLGEFAVVYGVGLIGLITVQLLKLSGIRVIAIDIDAHRLSLAKEYGADLIIDKSINEDAIEKVINFTDGRGADAVIFTASTTDNYPLSESFKMSRRKGKVVLVGVVGMEINREDMYDKEVDLLISTSYGPGRYDKSYEEDGIDYPYAYVRWTENRNMAEYCRLLSNGYLDLSKLLYKIFPIEKVNDAYEEINNVKPKPLLIVISYRSEIISKTIEFPKKSLFKTNSKVKVAIVGVGSFAKNVLIPNLIKLRDKFEIVALVDKNGLRIKEIASKYNISLITSEIDEILIKSEIDLYFITTRHNSHGNLTLKLLNAGKNVFVEKPLCTTKGELEEIKKFFIKNKDKKPPFLMVGYNRRFSKYIQEIKEITKNRINPMMIYYRMNAGYIPADSWVHKDGGRIVGEACHIIDLMNFLTGAKIYSLSYERISPRTEHYFSDDNCSLTLKYTDGSVCIINYFAVGSSKLNKEYMEIHFDGKSLILDDYKKAYGYGVKLKNLNSKQSDKGHLDELMIVYEALKTGVYPIELWDLFQTSEITLNII